MVPQDYLHSEFEISYVLVLISIIYISNKTINLEIVDWVIACKATQIGSYGRV